MAIYFLLTLNPGGMFALIFAAPFYIFFAIREQIAREIISDYIEKALEATQDLSDT
jgi:hypothetical protein